MLAFVRPDTGLLLRAVAVAALLAAGVLLVGLCAEGGCVSCAHECVDGADRPRGAAAAIVRALGRLLAAFAGGALLHSMITSARDSFACMRDAGPLALVRTAALRI